MASTLDIEVPIILTLLKADKRAEKLYEFLSADLFSDPRTAELYKALAAVYNKSGDLVKLADVSFMPQIACLDGFQLIFKNDIWSAIEDSSGVKIALAQMKANKTNKQFDDLIAEHVKQLAEAETQGLGPDEITERILKFQDRYNSIIAGGMADLSKSEQIRVLLDRSYKGKLTYEGVRKELKVSTKELCKLAKREEEKENPQWRRERLPNGKLTRHLMLCKGLSMVSNLECGEAKVAKADAAFLPGMLHRHIAKETQSLDQHSFTMYVAPTDCMKSNMCHLMAIENAQGGIKTILINTEADSVRLHLSIASKVTDSRVRSVEEANEIWKKTPYLKNLIVKQLRTQVDLIELLSHIRDLSPGLVIFDYLAQHFLGVTIPQQSSGPATMVQTIGVELCDNGIPVFAAIQGEIDDKGKMSSPETWIHRATLAFVAHGRPEMLGSDNPYIRITMAVRKNKHGGANNCLMDFTWCPQTLTIVNTVPLTWEDYAHRDKLKKWEEDEKLKEAKDSAKQRREAVRKANGSTKRNSKQKEVKNVAKLPTQSWKPDSTEILRLVSEEEGGKYDD